MNKAFRLGINDFDAMEELCFLNFEHLQYKATREALEYEMITIGGLKTRNV